MKSGKRGPRVYTINKLKNGRVLLAFRTLRAMKKYKKTQKAGKNSPKRAAERICKKLIKFLTSQLSGFRVNLLAYNAAVYGAKGQDRGRGLHFAG